VIVDNCTLTLTAGALVQFGGFFSITVRNSGKLIANGTSASHVVFALLPSYPQFAGITFQSGLCYSLFYSSFIY
jgi:hypothetical protein